MTALLAEEWTAAHNAATGLAATVLLLLWRVWALKRTVDGREGRKDRESQRRMDDEREASDDVRFEAVAEHWKKMYLAERRRGDKLARANALIAADLRTLRKRSMYNDDNPEGNE